jgi:hypothetical protein
MASEMTMINELLYISQRLSLEPGRGPVRPLIRAFIQILPCGSPEHQRVALSLC